MAVEDLAIAITIILATALLLPTIFGLVAQFVPGFKNAIPNLNPTSAGALDTTNRLYVVFDYGFVIFAVGIFIAMMISSYFINTHPVFFFASLIIWLIIIFIAPILSNFWNSYVNGLAFSNFDTTQKMPILTFIMQHYPEYALAMGAGTLLTLYMRFSRPRE